MVEGEVVGVEGTGGEGIGRGVEEGGEREEEGG